MALSSLDEIRRHRVQLLALRRNLSSISQTLATETTQNDVEWMNLVALVKGSTQNDGSKKACRGNKTKKSLAKSDDRDITLRLMEAKANEQFVTELTKIRQITDSAETSQENLPKLDLNPRITQVGRNSMDEECEDDEDD